MQLIGKDTIVASHMGAGGELLHRTTNGFQFGAGRDRQLVTQVSQVSMFHPAVQQEVQEWLASNGLADARKDLMDREVAEEASEQPGTLDAMAEKLGPDVKAQLFQMLKGALKQTVESPPSPVSREGEMTGQIKEFHGLPVVEDSHGIKHVLPDPELAKHPRIIPTDGGVFLDKGNGHKEFVIDADVNDLEEEQALIARQDSQLVGASAGTSKLATMKGKPKRR